MGNKRIRKKFTDMSIDEQNIFVKSLVKLKEVKPPVYWRNILSNDVSYYDSLVILHASQPPANLIAHRASGFLPWHRLFLLLIEDALHSVGYPCHLGFPYWEWEDEKDIIKISQGLFGEISPTNLLKFVENGEFGYKKHKWLLRIMTSDDFEKYSLNNNSFIRRNWATLGTIAKTEPQYNGAASINNLRYSYYKYSSYPYSSLLTSTTQVFSNTLEGWSVSDGTDQEPRFHNLGHVNIGGTMLNCLTSVNDPIFFLHHCNVDREWSIWQNIWQKTRKEKQNAFNVPLSIIGEAKINNNGREIIMDENTANHFALTLYNLMSQSIIDNDFPYPTIKDLNITMFDFIKKNKKGISLYDYIVKKVEGIILHISSDNKQTSIEQYLNPQIWYNMELETITDKEGFYQYFLLFKEPKYNEENQEWIFKNEGIWFWMQNVWVIQNVTQSLKFNKKVVRILGGSQIEKNTYNIIDLDTNENINFHDNNNPLDRPDINIGTTIMVADKSFYMSAMKDEKGISFETMLINETTSASNEKPYYFVTVKNITNEGIIEFEDEILDKDNEIFLGELPKNIVLLYNNSYIGNGDNKKTIFIGSRFGHNKYDQLGHFNAIKEVSTAFNMLDNNKLKYSSNGQIKCVEIIYE